MPKALRIHCNQKTDRIGVWEGWSICLAVALLAGLPTSGYAQSSSSKAGAPTVSMESSTSPTPRMGKDGSPAADFLSRHESFLVRAKQGPIGLLFLGDSITGGWGWTAESRKLWEQHFSRYQPANFGMPGDRTQNVLWRIGQGELDGISPRIVVLMIGTNNIGWPADDIVSGVGRIIKAVREKLPQSRILLVGILPRGLDPRDKSVAYMRGKIAAVNVELRKLDDGVNLRFIDFGQRLISPTGIITAEIMPDGLHLGAQGYTIWADAMRSVLMEMWQ